MGEFVQIPYTDDRMWAECPHCHEVDTLIGGYIETGVHEMFQSFECEACGGRWTEVYSAAYKEFEV